MSYPGYELSEYQRDAQRTASREVNDKTLAVSALGLVGEAGEVAELIKKYLGHGHKLDEGAVVKELGDVLWYIADIASKLNLTLAGIAEANIEKLRKRYPDGFDPERSKKRDDHA